MLEVLGYTEKNGAQGTPFREEKQSVARSGTEKSMRKKTLRREISLSGIGIHTGQRVNLCLKPSGEGEIVFRRKDLDGLEVRLDPKKIEARNSTCFSSKSCTIQTLEHLLATLYAFGLSSLIIELDGGEVPILDGSALPFVRAIQAAGLNPLPEKTRVIKVLKQASVGVKEGWVTFEPDEDFRISCTIVYDHPLIQKQELSLALNLNTFIREIAPARTFGFLKDVAGLRAQGLARGGSLDNALVLDEKGLMAGTLRYPDEFVRHKILDLVGDLSLLGAPLRAHVKAHKAGHRIHLQAVRFLLSNPDLWTATDA